MKKTIIILLLGFMLASVVQSVEVPEVYFQIGSLDFYTPLYNVESNPIMYNWVNAETLLGFETVLFSYPNKPIKVGLVDLPERFIDLTFGGACNAGPGLDFRKLFPYAGVNFNIRIPVEYGLFDYIGLWIAHDYGYTDNKGIINAMGYKFVKKI